MTLMRKIRACSHMEGKSDNGLGEWVTKRIQTVGKYLS